MLSIIICSVDDAKFGAACAMYSRLLPAGSFQVVRVSNARSLAEGYTRGIAASSGEWLILAHDDIEILNADLGARLAQHLGEYDVIGVAGTDLLAGGMWAAAGQPHIFGQVAHPAPGGGFVVDIYSAGRRTFGGMRAMDGVFLAMKRSAAERVGFDAATFDGFHLYDMDFTYRAHLAGLKLGVCCDIQVLHASVGNYDESWRVYAERFLQKFAGHVANLPPREFAWGFVRVADREQVRRVMSGAWRE